MSDADTQTEDTAPAALPDPDDIGSVFSTNEKPTEPMQAPPLPAAAAPSGDGKFASFDDFMNAKDDGKFASFDDFMKEPNLATNLAIGVLPRPLSTLAGIATGDELTPVQRDIVANQQIGRVIDAMGHNFNDYMENNAANSEFFKEGMAPQEFKNFMHQADTVNKGWWDGFVVPGAKTFASLIEHDAAVIAAPIRTTLSGIYHTPGALAAAYLGGGADDGTPGGIEQGALELGFSQRAARDLAEMPIALGGEGAFGPFTGFKESARDVAVRRNLLEPITGKVLGPNASEGTYFGTEPGTPQQHEAVVKAAAVLPPEEPQQNIHEVARGVDPDVMDKYHALLHAQNIQQGMLDTIQSARNEETGIAETSPYADEIAGLKSQQEGASARTSKKLQDQIDDLTGKNDEWLRSKSPYTEDIESLKQKIENARAFSGSVSAVERRTAQAKEHQAQLEALQAKNEQWLEHQRGVETPEVKTLRESLAKTNRDLADLRRTGRIAEAYRKAHEQMPEPRPQVVEPEEKPVAEPITPPEAVKPEESQAAPSLEQQKQNIVADVVKQLTAAGRPPEESHAAAQLVAEHYQAIADQGWAKGTAQEIYERHAAEIKAGKTAKAKVLAQKGGKDLAQKAKGKIRISLDDAKNVITLFKTADPSTFVHELGHHWLEEMMDFAAKEDAPQTLLDHAETVRNWLGVKEGEEIAPRQHEKFARGFERYLMEGVAPSRELATVFAQFKQWLTKIYQTVDRLKAPITPEIRNVFDHLLSAKPERTIVAPEAEPGAAMASIHVADARTTEPARAAEVRDNVEKEVDLTARQEKPEIEDELNRATETPEVASPTGGAPPPEQPSTVSGATGPGASEQPAAVAGGGSVPGSEGAATRAEPGKSRDTGERGPEARDNFIGNINMDKLVGGDGFEEAVRSTADKNDNFVTQRRGTMSIGQTIDLANDLGVDPAWLGRKSIGKAFNAEEIIAAKQLLIKAYDGVRKAAESLRLAGDNVVEKQKAAIQLAKALATHEYIQGKVSQAAAEAGRALAAHRTVVSEAAGIENLSAFLKQNTGRDLFQLEQMARFMEKLTPEQSAKLIWDTAGGKIRRGVLYYYINALLSGPITHARYFVGNEVKSLYRPLIETPIAASVGAVRQMFSDAPVDRVYFREVGAQLNGLVLGHKDGYYAGLKAWDAGYSDPLPGEKPFSGNDLAGAVPQIGGGEGIVNKAIDIYGAPQKAVSAIHSMNKTVSYTQGIYALATRTAIREGLEGEALINRITELKQNPTEDMMQKATKSALQQMYMEPAEYSGFIGNLSRAINATLPGKIMIPFFRIGSQITKETFVQGSPLGLFSAEVRANLAAGGAVRDAQIARMAAGTGLMATGIVLTSTGQMTGDGPADPKLRDEWLLTHKPNCLKLGSIYVPYSGLGSLGMALRFSANATAAAQTLNTGDMDTVAFAFLNGISKSVLDDNFMRGAKDALDALYNPKSKFLPYVNSMVTNWIPWSVGAGQVARMVDPDMREAHGLIETAMEKIPYVSESLFPKRDRYGEIIPQAGSIDRYKNDPVSLRLDALGIGISKVEPKIRGVALSEKQFDEFSTLAGRLTKLRLNALVASSGFSQLNPALQIQQITRMVNASHEQARGVMMSNYNDIVKQAYDRKVQGLR